MKSSSVVGIVNYNGKILIGKKRIDSTKFLAGEWHIPGEGVEGEETYKEALIRGIKEEAGLEIKVGKYLASHITPTSKRRARWYECFSDTDNIKVGSDLEDAKFVKKKDVLKLCSKRAYSLWPKEIIDYFSE
jgi:8-oxo-dGTP pyrophosphatase MutT (NUDIX family)